MKKEPFSIGDKIFLQEHSFYGRDSKPRPFVVVKANKSSAYATHENHVTEYYEGKYSYTVKIDQKTHRAKGTFSSYTLWRTMEEYDRAVEKAAEHRELLKIATDILPTMSTEDLKAFVEKRGK